MKTPEPTRLKLNLETPIHKSVSKIPMPPLDSTEIDHYDISMSNDIYIRPENDSIYKPDPYQLDKKN
jgi:hypothetical protein